MTTKFVFWLAAHLLSLPNHDPALDGENCLLATARKFQIKLLFIPAMCAAIQYSKQTALRKFTLTYAGCSNGKKPASNYSLIWFWSKWTPSGRYFWQVFIEQSPKRTKVTNFMSPFSKDLPLLFPVFKEFRKFSLDLTSPPPGYNSCHGLMSTEDEPSDFKVSCQALYPLY